MGATLMPGMIDAHLHLSWNNAPGIDPIQMMEVEEHMLVTMEMAKLVVDAALHRPAAAPPLPNRVSTSSPSASSTRAVFPDRVISQPARKSRPSAASATAAPSPYPA